MKDILAWSLRLAREQTLRLADDIPPDRGCLQSVPGEEHPVWTLGHLVLADAYLLTLLGTNDFPADFQHLIARFGPAAPPTSDAASYDSLSALRYRLEELGNQRQGALAAIGEAALARALPDAALARTQPTIGHHLQSLVFHEGHHAGKLAAWRRSHHLAAGRWAFAPPAASRSRPADGEPTR